MGEGQPGLGAMVLGGERQSGEESKELNEKGNMCGLESCFLKHSVIIAFLQYSLHLPVVSLCSDTF